LEIGLAENSSGVRVS